MIPAELRERDQWLGWMYVERNGKQTKVPLSARGGLGRSNDPATWSSYRDALSILRADGVGFVLSRDDPYVGLDIDDVISPSGRIHPVAAQIMSTVGGYQEFSVSGRGLHVLVRGRIARNRSTKKTPWHAELALFSSGKFFTCSGDGRGQITDAQAGLDALLAEFFPVRAASAPVASPKPFSDDDRHIVDLLLMWPESARLWAGDTADHAGDHSAADLALCSKLAKLTGNDPKRIDDLFRRSGLYRDKWNRPLGDSTYGQQTIQRATR